MDHCSFRVLSFVENELLQLSMVDVFGLEESGLFETIGVNQCWELEHITPRRAEEV